MILDLKNKEYYEKREKELNQSIQKIEDKIKSIENYVYDKLLSSTEFFFDFYVEDDCFKITFNNNSNYYILFKLDKEKNKLNITPASCFEAKGLTDFNLAYSFVDIIYKFTNFMLKEESLFISLYEYLIEKYKLKREFIFFGFELNVYNNFPSIKNINTFFKIDNKETLEEFVNKNNFTNSFTVYNFQLSEKELCFLEYNLKFKYFENGTIAFLNQEVERKKVEDIFRNRLYMNNTLLSYENFVEFLNKHNIEYSDYKSIFIKYENISDKISEISKLKKIKGF